ncbi:aldo/keto reductase [bacterium]|nr:aldo/keto reductase [bacterium]
MEYRFLGNSGLQVSALSYGSWVTFHTQADEDNAYELMKTAFDKGVNFFDNAEAYADGKSEILMGKVLKRAAWKRSDLIISTKIFWGGQGVNDRGLSHKHIMEGANNALKRLQLEYVDLIYCHRPDINTPMEEVVRAMNILINQGKAFYWGTSEWSAAQIIEAHAVAQREHLIPPLMEQPQYNLFHRHKVESEFTHLYKRYGLGTTIFSPLASGLLTGKYSKGIPDNSRMALKELSWLKERFQKEGMQEKIIKINKLKEIADGIDISLTQLALAWCLKNPNVSSVITGASKLSQMNENLKAVDVVSKINESVLNLIELVVNNKPEQEPDFRLM